MVVQQAQFCRPSVQAALELGAESFWEVVETLLASTTLDFEAHLQRMAPEVSEGELHRCGRAIRRAICAALLDRSMSPDELRDELRILVDGYVKRVPLPLAADSPQRSTQALRPAVQLSKS